MGSAAAWRRVVSTVVTGSVLLVACTTDSDAPAASRPTSAGPNILLVMVDDARPDEMQRVADARPGGGFDWVRDNGVQFTRTWSTNNLCCPGRWTVLTGQTVFNHGQKENGPYRDIENALPSWLQDGGYCTALTGKYVNGYNEERRPEGWDLWEPLIDSDESNHKETGFTMQRRDGSTYEPDVFMTDHLLAVAREQMSSCFDEGRPLFQAFWPYAPHGGSDPEADYEQAKFPVEELLRDPRFDEADISDKPRWLQEARPTQTEGLAANSSAQQRHRLRTLLSVDDAVEQLITDLEERGELSNTAIIFTSDNGFLLGEHRLIGHKQVAYEAAQPTAWIAGPGFPSGVTSDAYAMNIDLAPTIARLAGVEPAITVDGLAWQDLLAAPELGHDRFLPFYVPIGAYEPGDDIQSRPQQATDGMGMRTWRYKYVEWADGSTELYDLFEDPYELDNASADPAYASILTQMQDLLESKRDCAGDACREPAPLSLQE